MLKENTSGDRTVLIDRRTLLILLSIAFSLGCGFGALMFGLGLNFSR